MFKVCVTVCSWLLYQLVDWNMVKKHSCHRRMSCSCLPAGSVLSVLEHLNTPIPTKTSCSTNRTAGDYWFHLTSRYLAKPHRLDKLWLKPAHSQCLYTFMYETKLSWLLNIKLLSHNCNYIQCRATYIMKRKRETLTFKENQMSAFSQWRLVDNFQIRI